MAKSRTQVVIRCGARKAAASATTSGYAASAREQLELTIVRERREVGLEDRKARDAALCGAAPDRRDAGVRVLHVVDGVLHRLRRDEVEVEGLLRVDALQEEGEARDVGIDLVEDVGERDDGAGALRQPHQLAAALEFHELAEQHLGLGGWVAECLHPGLQRLHLAVVVGAPDVDEVLPAPRELVAVVGDVGER